MMKNVKLSLLLVAICTLILGCCPCRKAASRVKLLETESSWQTVQMGSHPLDGEGYTLTFGKDGVLSGQGDCNRIMGEWSSDDNRSLSFSNVATTRAMCEDYKGEDLYFASLGRCDSYSIDGDKLLLLSNGEVLLIMERYEQE